MVSQRRLELTKSWQGNNTFLFGGRWMLGPDNKALTATVLLLSAPTALFLGMVGVDLGNRLSWAFEAIVALAYITTLWALVLTATTDPGVIPRCYELPDPELAAKGTNPMTKEIMVNGRLVKTKFCLTCNTYRPPRCSHCRVCDNCVEKFDHHCPWVGTCIGKRNYRFFFFFVSTATFMDIFCFGCSLLRIYLASQDDSVSFFGALRTQVPSAVLVVYCFIFFWFVGGLTFFHTYLLLTNQTTYEHFKASGGRFDRSPYYMGLCENARQALCVVHGSLLDAPPVHIHSQNAKGKQEADKPQPAMASIEMPLVPGPSAKSLEASGHQCGGTHSGNGGSHETWQPHAPNAAATITADSSLTPFVAAGEAGGVGNRRGVLSPSPSSSNVGRRTAVMPGVVA